MEQERVIRVEWKQPFPHPSSLQQHQQHGSTLSGENKHILGPTIIPTVSSPVPFGAHLSDAEKFRYIDSSGSTLTGTSRAGLADAESIGDEELIRETAIPVHIEPLSTTITTSLNSKAAKTEGLNQNKDVEAQTSQPPPTAAAESEAPQPRPRQDIRRR
uniref:Uncharacterized protein n=1 Tax=Panagrolaimus sp. ES5 TaxID=591445 RepID=A0AC34GGQ0_9BILA